MALQAAYKQYLASPNSSFFSEKASLHYITTLTTFNGPAEIIKHLNSQSNKIKRKEEKVIDAIEAEGALFVEVETTLEFVLGGGAYLPAIDDNFLADRTVTFPIIHIVSFDNGKISQIRLSWDQGSLLKLIDVIGKTGRNWPIRDGKDQIKLIINSINAAGNRTTGGSVPTPAQQQSGEEKIRRSRENSTNVTRDPHASLALFAPRDSGDSQQTLPAVVPPRASAKPPQRDYHDLFVGYDSNSKPEIRPDSPHKHAAYGAVAPKAGAGKNFQANRIFDNDENAPIAADGRDKVYQPNPKKFQHFDIASGTNAGESNNAPQSPSTKKNTKGGASWSFDDFNTPGKTIPTKSLAVRPQAGQDVRHWGTENDEVPESPIRRPYVDKPRKDAQTHFEFQDESPAPKRQQEQSNFKDGITIAGDGMGSRKQPVNEHEIKQKGITIAGDGMGSRKQPSNEREVKQKGINIAGDGMGGKKGGRSWGFGDESDPEPEQRQHSKGGAFRKDLDPHFAYTDDSPAPKRTANQKENAPRNVENSPTRNGGLSEATNTMSSRNNQPKGISIGGDGMGGKAGAGRSWGFGDESDGEQDGGVNAKGGNFQRGVAPKRQGNAQQTGGGDFWNY